MSRYEAIIKEYIGELREARQKALAWWESLIVREAANVGDRAQALKQLKLRWQVGPVSHPYVIDVYRKYYIRIDELNEKLENEQAKRGPDISPESEASWGTEGEDIEKEEEEGTIQPVYLLRGDLEQWDPELHDFMQPLVFAPIGVDRNGRTA